MYRGGRRRQWLAVVGVVTLVVAVILGIRWMGGGSEPAKADAGTSPRGSGAVAKNPADDPTKASPGGATQGPAKPNAPSSTNGTEQPRISMGGAGAKPTATGGAAPGVAPGTQTPNRQAAPTQGSPAPKVGADTPKQTPERSGLGAPTSTATPTAEKPKAGSPTPTSVVPSNASAQQRIDRGLALVKENKPIEARRVLTEALTTSGIAPADVERVRGELTTLNDRLIFSPEVVSGDPFVSVHQIQSGDALAKLPKQLGLNVDWRFLQRVNRISDPARIQVGQRVKVVKGPFHAVIDKRAFRLDLYLGDGSDRVYVRSFSVGLGEYGATPEGEFIIKPNSKLEYPAWTNPRTGEHFASKDPKNPLGKYWIGLVGVSDNIRGLEGYGLHGTIEPESIGQERSMGCVRMREDDIRMMFEVLIDNISHVEIHGPDWP